MPRLIQPLPDGPVDIVGDVHGEIEALLALLHRLGVNPDRRTAARPVVFVGDLVDRGPDSVAVVELVAELRDARIAYCIAGNHELNVLANKRKEGNAWYYGEHEHAQIDGQHVPVPSRPATPSEREHIRTFLADLPVVLERPDLRVVHACWKPELGRLLPEQGDIATLMEERAGEIKHDLAARGVDDRAAEERAEFADLTVESVKPTRYLHAVAEAESAHQSRNPIKVLTSGPELPCAEHFFTGGKWRFVARERWWAAPAERTTVIGHYWRRRGGKIVGKPDLWDTLGPWTWANNVYCVDYSVGRRFHERAIGRDRGFTGGLGALRWPERVMVFDDREGAIATE